MSRFKCLTLIGLLILAFFSGVFVRDASFSKESNLLRAQFIVPLEQGALEEYQRRHSPIWKELEEALKEHGLSDYTISYDEQTNSIIGFLNYKDAAQLQALSETAASLKWNEYMNPLFIKNNEGKPLSRPLKEVFHLD